MRLQAVLDAVLRWQLAVGLAAGGLGVAVGVLVGRRRRPPPWGLLLAVPAAAGMLWVSGPPGIDPGWVPLVIVVAVVAAGLAVGDVAAASPHRRAVPALVVLTAGGVFVTVPDTEQALVVLGAALPVAAAATAGRWPLGRGGGVAVAAVVGWAVAVGVAPRPGSVVGGLACFGVLLVEPLWRRIARQPDAAAAPWAAIALVGGHAAAVLVAGRVAGMRAGALEALPLAVVALAVAAGSVICVTWLSARAGRATLAQSPPSGGPRSRGAA